MAMTIKKNYYCLIFNFSDIDFFKFSSAHKTQGSIHCVSPGDKALLNQIRLLKI